MPYFSEQLIKAINNWQAGSKDKARKAKKLAEAVKAHNLDAWFLGCDDDCFRRSVLTNSAVSELFFEFEVSEETSSWSVDQTVVFRFKGGPPLDQRPGVIFKHRPQLGQVILNLDRLYQHPEFWKSAEHWESTGINLQKGIRKYANIQREVVMLLDKVPHDEIFAFGGDSAPTIAAGNMDGATIIGSGSVEPDAVRNAFSDAGAPVHKWVTGEGVQNIYRGWVDNALRRLAAKSANPSP